MKTIFQNFMLPKSSELHVAKKVQNFMLPKSSEFDVVH